MMRVQLTVAGGHKLGAPHDVSSDTAVQIREYHDRGYDVWVRHTPIGAKSRACAVVVASRELDVRLIENLDDEEPAWLDELRTYLAVTDPVTLQPS